MCVLTWRSTAVRLIGAALERPKFAENIVYNGRACSRRVAHKFRLMSREYHQTVRPRCVPDLCTPQEELVGTQRYRLWYSFVGGELNSTLIGVQ